MSREPAWSASPIVVLSTVPGLVAAIGIFLTILGGRAVRQSNLEAARERLSEQTVLVAGSIDRTLEQAEPLLDRLAALARAHDPGRPFEAFAHRLVDLMQGRRGVKFVSVSYPDGTFQGANLETDGVIRFQDSRLGENGTHARHFAPVNGGGLRLERDEYSTYDPRMRDFYRLAVETRGRAWTDPYPFFGTNTTGVTRTEAVYADDGSLLAVVTVDFDLDTLSSSLKELELPGSRALLYRRDGAVLGYPQGLAALRGSKPRSDRPLRHSDFADPVLARFFLDVSKGVGGQPEFHDLTVGEESFVAAVAPASEPALGWFLAYIAPTRHFMRTAAAYEREGLAIAAAAVLAAVLIAWLFARSIVQAREETALARAEAREARKTAQQLGQYVLEQKLGQGGMGVVYKARHALLRRPTAIKLLAPEQVGEKAIERFAREVRLTARLTHPNTVTVYDYGTTSDGIFYYAMELLDGVDLEELVRLHGPLPARRVRHILQQVAEALAEAHAIGLIHRDVTPANIMLCGQTHRHEVAKLLDFGLVRDVTEAEIVPSADRLPNSAVEANSLDPDRTRTGVRSLTGTPLYMAPEAISKPERVGPASDLYALAAVGYFLLVGRPVFEGASVAQLCDQHLHATPAAPSLRLGSPVPEGLEAIILRCLAKDPSARVASASALAEALLNLNGVGPWTADEARAWWEVHPRPIPVEAPASQKSPEVVTVSLLGH